MPNPIVNRRQRKRRASNWTPLNLPNLWGWWRSDQGVLAPMGNLVLQWSNITGSGVDFAQGTDSLKPSLITNVINGYDGIRFDGVDDYLKTTFANLDQPVTIFAVLRPDAWSDTKRFWDGDSQNSGGVFQFGVSPNITQYAGSFGGGAVELSVGSFGLITNIFNSVSSSIQVNNGVVGTGDAGTNNMDGFTLGESGTTGLGLASAITIAELIVMNAVATPSEIQQVKNYVSSRYGISM